MRVPGNEIFHARINSRSGGGAAGPRTCAQRQQPRVEVLVRLDVRLPGCRGAGRAALQVPSVRSYAYDMLHIFKPHQGVGTGMQDAEPISEADRFSKLHCGRCMKPLSESPITHLSKALNKDAWYWVCGIYDEELRARGGQDSKAVWDCPTARDGGQGCKCCCKAKQAPPHSKRCKSGFTPPKARKLQARRKKQFEVRWGGAFAHYCRVGESGVVLSRPRVRLCRVRPLLSHSLWLAPKPPPPVAMQSSDDERRASGASAGPSSPASPPGSGPRRSSRPRAPAQQYQPARWRAGRHAGLAGRLVA